MQDWSHQLYQSNILDYFQDKFCLCAVMDMPFRNELHCRLTYIFIPSVSGPIDLFAMQTLKRLSTFSHLSRHKTPHNSLFPLKKWGDSSGSPSSGYPNRSDPPNNLTHLPPRSMPKSGRHRGVKVVLVLKMRPNQQGTKFGMGWEATTGAPGPNRLTSK